MSVAADNHTGTNGERVGLSHLRPFRAGAAVFCGHELLDYHRKLEHEMGDP
jgi:hypothetical protein